MCWNLTTSVKSLHHPTTVDMTTFLANLTINVLTFWAGYVLVDSFDGNLSISNFNTSPHISTDGLSTGIQDSTTAMDVDNEMPNQKTIYTYMNKATISEKMRMCIELLLFPMFICCTLPWSLLDSSFCVDFILGLNPAFHLPDCSSFFLKHLTQEVSTWMEIFKTFISNYSHLTLSFDGWSAHKNDEIYTFHTTMPKCHLFFTYGHVFKGLSVTGDALLFGWVEA